MILNKIFKFLLIIIPPDDLSLNYLNRLPIGILWLIDGPINPEVVGPGVAL